MGIINSNKKGFTLVEIVITFAVVGLILPILFNIIFTIINEEIKIYRLTEVKRQGDFALNEIENTIRNFGYKIYSEAAMTNERCTSATPTYGPINGTNFFIKDKYASLFRFYKDLERPDSIASYSAKQSDGSELSTVYLTNSKVAISDFLISCQYVTDYSAPLITVTFKVEYVTTGTRPEETASMDYRTSVRPRSF